MFTIQHSPRHASFRTTKEIFYQLPNNHHAMHTQANKTRGRHLLSTLNSSRFNTSDYLDLSNRAAITIRFPNSPYGLHDTPQGHLCYQSDRRTLFPAQASGFLYYHRDPDAAPLERSIRFRVTGTDRAPSFALGHDLLLPSGIPWQIILFQIACTTQYLSPHPRPFSRGESALDDAVSPQPRIRSTENGRYYYPWAGSAVARFEPSANSEHAGRRVVCLRIVRIVTPVSCTVNRYKGQVVKPEEGQLLTRSLHGPAPAPWSYDIDAH
ncbi:hypothetical protein C8R45DRAFT_1026787, partial [Mycena sanguinolenta]